MVIICQKLQSVKSCIQGDHNSTRVLKELALGLVAASFECVILLAAASDRVLPVGAVV